MSRFRSHIAAVTIALTLACGGDGVTSPNTGGNGGSGGGSGVVAAVRFTPAERAVMLYDSIPLSPNVTDAAGRVLTGRAVTWASSDTEVATVSATGWVKGLHHGQTTITAIVGGKQGSAVVTVNNPPVATITMEASEVTVDEATTHPLVATPRDAEGRLIPGLGKVWRTSAPDVALVDAAGVVTAIRPGTARVSVTVHGQTAEATIVVTANHPYDLVYQSFDGAASALWQLDLRDAAGVPVRLVPSMDGANPAVSPDGSRIAFLSGGSNASIWIANRDGSGARHLVTGSQWLPAVYHPAWSPDGTKIAYTHRADSGLEEIRIVEVATGNILVTTEAQGGNQSWPSWSPARIDGSYRIAYAQGAGALRQIWTMREDGTDVRAVTSGTLYDGQPAWSPDGQTIAFQRVSMTVFDIWLVNASGGNERRLIGLNLGGAQSAPIWSPDGQLIAFASPHETYGQAGSVSQIYTVRTNGTGGIARRTNGGGDKQFAAWIQRAP